jgi:hypothetical protein
MLMATVNPIFSLWLICCSSRNFHGRKANTTSTSAEYAIAPLRQLVTP